MAEPLPRAIAVMFTAFNMRHEPERVDAFVDALTHLDLCHDCGAIAAGNITAYLRHRPVPSDLCLEARDVMQTPVHMNHLGTRRLAAGDGTAWWQTEARAIIGGMWPDCPNPGWVADQMRRIGIVRTDPEAVRADVGNPGTMERAWWERHAAANLERA